MFNEPNILMVEDDPNLGYLLKENFKLKGLHVYLCKDGEEGLRALQGQKFDLCILDVMMPKKDGFTLAKEIRKSDKLTPIIFLTAKNAPENIYDGFQAGGDDYVTKPFDAQELYYRIQAILKRTQSAFPVTETKYKLGALEFDTGNRSITGLEAPVHLSQKEADLLKIFCENPDELLSRKLILTRIWGRDDYFTSNSMDVYLTRLRKILRCEPKVEIRNLHGTGFKLVISDC